MPGDRQTDNTTDRQTDKHIKKYNTKTVARAALAKTATTTTAARRKGKARTLPGGSRRGRAMGWAGMWAGSARIFMAWRRSNLIKVPAPRQHLECESALAVWWAGGLERVRVSTRMRRDEAGTYFATLLVG